MKTLVAIGKTNTGLYFHLESNNFKTKKAYKESLEAVGMKVEAIFGEDQIREIQSDVFKVKNNTKDYVWETDFGFQGELSDKAMVGNIAKIDNVRGVSNFGEITVVVKKVDRNYKGKVTSVEVIVTEGNEFTQAGQEIAFDGTYFKRMANLIYDVKAEKERIEAEAKAKKEAEEQAKQNKKMLEMKEIKEAGVFNETEQKIVDKLVKGNMEWYERMSAKLKEDGYKEWHKKMLAGYISSTDLSIMNSSEAYARKTFEEDASNKVIKLKLRVGKIVGKIEKYDLNVAKNGDLEGFVLGDQGKARVNIFYAGGWNVQRLHFRATVREIK